MDRHSNSESVKRIYDVLGTLLEAAIRDQKLTGEAIATMNQASNALDQQRRVLPREIAVTVKNDLSHAIDAAGDQLIDKVRNANIKADEAAESFRRATQNATFFVCLPALLTTFAVMALWYLVAAHAVNKLEAERDSLQKTVDVLSSHGGRLNFSNCKLQNGQTQLCVKVEPTEYGPGYHIPVWK